MVKRIKKTVLPLLMGFILALQPVAYTFAEETSSPVTTEILLGVNKTIEVVVPSVVSENAEAFDENEQPIPVNPGELDLTISEDDDSIDLPFTLDAGQDIESFTDPDTGITITGEDVRIPLKNEQDEEILVITARKTTVQSGDTTTRVTLENVVLESSEFISNMSSADPAVGTIGVSFEVELDVLPENVEILTQVTKTAESGCRESFDEVARAAQKYIANIAYVLEVDKTNLDNGVHLGEATITMKVGIQWMQEFGFDNIVILRCGEEGQQELETEYIGNDGSGNAIFRAQSPVGLSFFGLVAYSTRSFINWLVIGSTVGGVVLLLIVAFFIILRRRRLRAERISSTWSTGLDADDWKDVD
jgi:hypothetical protein